MKTHYCFGNHLGFSGDTPINLNCECLQAPWRGLAFREKALDSTQKAYINEHTSDVYPYQIHVSTNISKGMSYGVHNL